MKSEIKTYRINFDFGPFKKGQKVNVEIQNGQTVDRFWRDRLKDSEIDNCISLLDATNEEQAAPELAAEPVKKKRNAESKR